MKTRQLQVMASAALVLFSGISSFAQGGGGNIDPAQIQQGIAQFQQRIGQMDPAQLQQMAAQFMPGVAQMDPAQFQQITQQWQQGMGQLQQRIGQVDPAQLQQRAQQLQQLGAGNLGANSQFQQRRIASLREQLQVPDDTEWSVIEALIQKVMAAQRVVQADQNGSQQFGAAFANTTPEADAVGKAVLNNASNTEILTALTKLVAVRKTHLADLEKAQADLRAVLTLKQEAVATVNGLL